MNREDIITKIEIYEIMLEDYPNETPEFKKYVREQLNFYKFLLKSRYNIEYNVK